MRVWGIVEGTVENTYRICNPAIRDVDVCETGFLSELDACQSLIDTGWRIPPELHVQWALGSGAWVRRDDGDETDEDGQPIVRVRYVFEMEVPES